MGVLASVVGLFLGLGLAKGLFKLFDAVGFTLPNSGLIFQTRTIVVSLLVGIIVTLLASLLPGASARRACRRSPPCARARRCPGPLRALPDAGSPRCSRLLGFAGAALRAVRARSRDDADPALHGRRDAAGLPRRRAVLGAARARRWQRPSSPVGTLGGRSLFRVLFWPFCRAPVLAPAARRRGARAAARVSGCVAVRSASHGAPERSLAGRRRI